jgi:oxygen-independent coproporphyrinogen-3 oxidase
MKTKSLYIHIPFCQAICSYCDFCKVYYQEDLVDRYLQALTKELEDLQIREKLVTIYIGGGTPSSLSYQQLELLMSMIAPYISKQTIEVSIEINPESIDQKKLDILKKGRVNRLSIGVQTFHEEILKTLERKHNNAQVISVIKEAKRIGFDTISIDMMYGLPNQTLNDIERDLEIIKTLDIQHISYYSLILEKHTRLKNEEYKVLDDELETKIQDCVETMLSSMGFKQYEISNYAKRGCTSKHNLAYWKYENYYGIGAGASSKIDDKIIEHNRNIYAYVEGKNTKKETSLSKEDSLFNHIMMSLRLLEGLDIQQVNRLYNIDLEKKYSSIISKYINKGWLHITAGKLHCNNQSIRFLNTILIDFLE